MSKELNYFIEDKQFIKSALERKEKLETLIKNKNPRLSLIKSMIKTNTVDFETYNKTVFDYERLTETEFNDLVKMLEKKDMPSRIPQTFDYPLERCDYIQNVNVDINSNDLHIKFLNTKKVIVEWKNKQYEIDFEKIIRMFGKELRK